MKSFSHTVASLCGVIWVVGFFGYDLGGYFTLFLLTSILATAWRLMLERSSKRSPKKELEQFN
jgi:hypothetical protein